MTPEIIGRVDAWLARAAAPQSLEKVWRHLRAIRYSSSHADVEDAIGAAMRGVLLELVRWAWSCDRWRRLTVEPAGDGWCLVLRNGRHRPPSRAQEGWSLDPAVHMRYVSEIDRGPFGRNEYATEDEALACALEAAPRREAA